MCLFSSSSHTTYARKLPSDGDPWLSPKITPTLASDYVKYTQTSRYNPRVLSFGVRMPTECTHCNARAPVGYRGDTPELDHILTASMPPKSNGARQNLSRDPRVFASQIHLIGSFSSTPDSASLGYPFIVPILLIILMHSRASTEIITHQTAYTVYKTGVYLRRTSLLSSKLLGQPFSVTPSMPSMVPMRTATHGCNLQTVLTSHHLHTLRGDRIDLARPAVDHRLTLSCQVSL